MTGRHPLEDFRHAAVQTVFSAQCKYDPLPPSTYLPGDIPARLSQGIDLIFKRACSKDPDDRFQTAADMREAMLVFCRRSRRSGTLHGALGQLRPCAYSPASLSFDGSRCDSPASN